jgi:pimeloyl-ACP methyl ester carboxylesterase
VFYPGGKVAAEAYAPLMHEFAEEGLFCVIVKVPFNLAFFDVDAANGVLDAYPQVKTWYVGGHSLGGVAACQWAAGNAERIAGLILLASYSSTDLTGTGLRVLEVYGSNDTAMNRDNYAQSQALLPKDVTEVVIQGGNHAQFGEYGEQNGDSAAAIPAENQREQAVEAIMNWLGA